MLVSYSIILSTDERQLEIPTTTIRILYRKNIEVANNKKITTSQDRVYMTCNNKQVELLMKYKRQKPEINMTQLANKADMSAKTARKYLN